MVNLTILWEDEDILVINKPPFVVVNRAESIKTETVQDWADRHCDPATAGEAIYTDMDRHAHARDDVEVFRKRSGVAHRLDKETSGCLLIAKNPGSLTSLLKQFKNRTIKKEYLALVHGRLSPKEGTVRLPLSRSRFDREKWEIRYSGKMAETSWKVEKHYLTGSEPVEPAGSEPVYSLVRLFPKTGRTHQIRVHLAHLGFPIYADEKYLTRSLIGADRARLPHHFLHAEKIGFFDGVGKWQTVTAPLPSDSLKLLSWIEDDRSVLRL